MSAKPAIVTAVPSSAHDDLSQAVAVMNAVFLGLGNSDGLDTDDRGSLRRTLNMAISLVGVVLTRDETST